MAKLPDFITAENELDGQEHVYIAQGGKTRKTLLQKIKEFVIGTATMGTTATDITGAIAEHTSQLNDKANKIESIIYKDTFSGSENLNDIVEPGIYQIADVTNISNAPNKSWSILEVVASNTYVKQIYTNSVDGDVFVRARTESKWTEWNQVSKYENIDLINNLRNGWHVGNCSFRGKKIGNEMFIEGIIVNNLESPNIIIAQGLPIPSDGKWHGGSSMCSDNSSIYLVIEPNGDLIFQNHGQKKDLLYTISINYPV